MNLIKRFLLFWYDFIVGDDWHIAAAVVASLFIMALLLRIQIVAWWLLPVAVLAFLGFSLNQATRK